MSNPIEQAEILKTTLVRVLNEVQMAPRWKSAIQGMVDQTHTIVETLIEIDTNIVPLALKDGAKQHASSLEFYRSLPGGLIDEGQPEYERLITQSATLRAFYQAGFDVLGMRKFDERELRFASEMGDRFGQWHDAWNEFKLTVKNGNGSYTPRTRSMESWFGFLDFLQKHRVIESYKSFYKDYKKNEFIEAGKNKIRQIRGVKDDIRFDWLRDGRDFDSLISGHWFSAFAYSIIVDHLDRLGADYEIYTLVRYKAPGEVVRSAGDLDVVVRAGDKVLMIECKSGWIGQGRSRDDFAEIKQKAGAVQQVFKHVSSDFTNHVFWLVYNPYRNKTEDVAVALRGTEIKPVKPEDIRGEVRRCFEAREVTFL